MTGLDRTALVVVDVQRAFEDAAYWGRRNNPACEANVAALLGVLDATHTFDRAGPDGTVMTADELARATATSLHGEFATVVSTADLTEWRPAART
jgi:hypothetical protein